MVQKIKARDLTLAGTRDIITFSKDQRESFESLAEAIVVLGDGRAVCANDYFTFICEGYGEKVKRKNGN